jgi:hypothetical protein
LCSWLKIELLGHLPMNQSSTNAKIGCANTCSCRKTPKSQELFQVNLQLIFVFFLGN